MTVLYCYITIKKSLADLTGRKGHAADKLGFFAILGRGPRVFQIGKSSAVNPLIEKFDIVHNYIIFGQ